MMKRLSSTHLPAPVFATVLMFTSSSAAAQDLSLETTSAEMARAPLERVYDGTVEAVHQATMSAQTAGRIAEVFYDVDELWSAESLERRRAAVG